MIVITTMNSLPEYCYECSCQDHESGFCQADKEHRSSVYRPFWCPLKDQEEDKPKGRWIPYEPDKRGYTNEFTCSRCKLVISSDHYCKMIDFDFCPYCGAYMDNAEGR